MGIRQWMRNSAAVAGVAALVPVGVLTSTANADQNIYKDDRTSVDVGLEVGAGIFHSSEDYSGQGRDDVTWQEWYVKPSISATFSPSADWGTFYGKVSGMFTATTGDGDAAGFTTGDEAKVDLEDGYAGWRSGELFPELGEDAFDISGGAQYFEIGDGFLIAGDPLSLGDGLDSSLDRGGAYWYAARKAFRKTGVFRFKTGTPVRGDVFYLGSDNNGQAKTELAGINIEGVDADLGTVGFSWLSILDVDEDVAIFGPLLAGRDGMNVFSVRGQGSVGVENLFLSFEFVRETNNGAPPEDIDAYAWYVEGGWTFADLPWSPSLHYRFSSFSGDDPNTTSNEAFDPLFYGITLARGLGTWYQGEVAGNYTGPFNTNANIHHVGVHAKPLDNVGAHVLYFNFNTRETAAGVGDHFGQEIDVYLDWAVTDNLWISPLYGLFIPGDGAEAAFGNDNLGHYFQLLAVVTF